jgi:hypothetical protein
LLGYTEEDDEKVIKPKMEIGYKEPKQDGLKITFDCADSNARDLLKHTLVLNYEKRWQDV